VAAIGLLALSFACSSQSGTKSPGGASATGGTSGVGGAGTTAGGAVTSMPPTGYDPKTLDPGFVPVHRLTNTEYNNAVGDLLGTTLKPADFFQAQTGTGFDTNAGPLSGITSANAQAYFDAAKALVDDIFKNPTLKAKVVTCQPAASGDTACAQTIINSFGRLAFRRPVEATELTQLSARYTEALTTLGKDHEGAVGHVLRVMLTSAPFLYWIEIDPDLQAAATDKRGLTGYELASRLSLTLWGSLPDSALLDLAANGSLTDAATLSAQVDRLLDDPKGPRFIDAFFNQWLHVTNLGGHQVDAKLYPAWNETMRTAMFADAKAFFSSFVYGTQPWSQFLTAPLKPSAGLEGIYSADPPGLRKGFLGLPAFLTAESVPTRTAPTFRGKVVLESVMCTPITVPANLVIPDLDQAAAGMPESSNIRVKLQAHRADPNCASCHNILDPIGFGLEDFDAVGKYRTAYPNGDPVDTSGVFDSKPFTGLDQLIPILTNSEHYNTCPSEKLLSFALRRIARPEDQPYLEQLAKDWNAGTVRELVKKLVLSDAFRFRKLPASAL
jgi:Protein of unknown function (DUF1592)/Protein of unknown function (DUF1588)/Protein of unknown function (DUF1595)/Protein of unknown function (DUF1587)/Protein of unknown function (DUF1585)